MILDNFSTFTKNCVIGHISALIHARVVGPREDVVTLRDQMMRVARFSCGFLGDKAGTKNQGAYI